MSKKDNIFKKLDHVRDLIHVVTEIIQYVLALIIVAGIAVQLTALPSSFMELLHLGTAGFHGFLEYVIDMVIGVEIIHLLVHPNLDNVVEVLLIAITRELVLSNPSPLNTLAGVASLAILFAVRKYLFIEKLDK